MGRLDLRDTYRDEDFGDACACGACKLGGDASNPGTRQVLAHPAKGGDSSDGARPSVRPVAPVLAPRAFSLEITPFGSQVRV